MPPRLPTELPYRPSQEPAGWTGPLERRVEEAHQYVTAYRGSRWENVQVLDQLYAEFVDAFEAQLCLLTDTPRRHKSARGKPPRIRWVESSRRAERQLKSWRTLDGPLVWMTHWVQNVIRYISGTDEDTNPGFLEQDLEECPTEF